MSNIITTSAFVGPISIAQLSQASVANDVNAYIAICQPAYLDKCLGASLAAAFIAGLDATPPVEQKWLDLRDGKVFTNTDGRSCKFEGLKDPLANYTYFCFRRDKATLTAGVGEVIPESERSYRISAAVKMSAAWNKIKTSNLILWNFLFVNMIAYGLTEANFGYRTWDPNQYCLLDADVEEMLSTINEFDI